MEYIVSGDLSNFIQTLRVVKSNYVNTGAKGILYFADVNNKFGVNSLLSNMQELSCLQQEYIDSYKSIDIKAKYRLAKANVINFEQWKNNKYSNIYSWSKNLSRVYNCTIPDTWLNIDIEQHNKVVIHFNSDFKNLPDNVLYDILNNNDCVFMSQNTENYDNFKYNKLVPFKKIDTFIDGVNYLAGCKFFIGNQTHHLAVACGLGKPCLVDISNNLYINENVYWITNDDYKIDGLVDKLVLSTDVLNSLKLKFTNKNGLDREINKYFNKTNGTCIEVGVGRPMCDSNTYYFEQNGWKCVCIEPNKLHHALLRKNRKNVLPFATGVENKDNVKYELIVLDDNKTVSGSLHFDQRFISKIEKRIKKRAFINVNIRTLDDIIEKNNINDIDFIIVTTKGTEYETLQGLQNYSPHLIVVENIYEDENITNLLIERGYQKVERFANKDFFIK